MMLMQSSRRRFQIRKRRRMKLELPAKILRQMSGLRIHHSHIDSVKAGLEETLTGQAEQIARIRKRLGIKD